jgi:hypothetical protein
VWDGCWEQRMYAGCLMLKAILEGA